MKQFFLAAVLMSILAVGCGSKDETATATPDGASAPTLPAEPQGGPSLD